MKFLNELKFLGYDKDLNNYFYSTLTKTLIKTSVEKMNKTLLSVILRAETLKKLENISIGLSDKKELLDELTIDNMFSVFEKCEKEAHKKQIENKRSKTQTTLKPDYFVIFSALSKLNISIGQIDVDKIFGSGCFELDENSLIVNSKELFIVNKNKEIIKQDSRIINKQVYEFHEDLDFNEDNEEITKEELIKIYECLNTFSFQEEQDVDTLLGWLSHGYFSGSLNWRTHLSITGSRGSGKSTLVSFMSNLLNKFGLEADGNSTEAGLKQKIKKSAKAVLLDESEADGRKIARNLLFFRSCSSSKSQYRGTKDNVVEEFNLKVAGCIAGIVPPIFNAADASRFLQINMNRAKGVEEIHDFLKTSNKFKVNKLGSKLFTYLVKNYFDILNIQSQIRKIMQKQGRDGRFIETNGIILAFAYFLKNTVTELALEDFINQYDFSQQEEMNDEKDEDNLIDFLFSQQVKIIEKQDTMSLIACLAEIKNNERSKSEIENFKNSLLNYSVFPKFNENNDLILSVDTSDENFKTLLKNKKDCDVRKVMLRNDNVKAFDDSQLTDKRVRFSRLDKKRKTKNIIEINVDKIFFDDCEIISEDDRLNAKKVSFEDLPF